MTKFRLAVSLTRQLADELERPAIPAWLSLDRHDYERVKDKHSHKYWTKIYWATPPWLNEKQIKEMKKIYNSTKRGEHVDHVVPLKHPLVCGLHVPWNLQKLTDRENLAKSNHMWPGHPNEPMLLFDDTGHLCIPWELMPGYQYALPL